MGVCLSNTECINKNGKVLATKIPKYEQLKFTINVNDKKLLFYHQNFIFD